MIRLHRAAAAELDAPTLYRILRLRSEVFVVEQDCPYQDIDGRDLEPGTAHMWLSEDDGEILAYLRVLEDAGGIVRIGRVCVAARGRRQGHAGTLLAAAVDGIGDREAVLDAQSYATALYRDAGFEVDGPEFVEDGIPHVPMRRRI